MATQQVEIEFNTGMSMRDILSQPQLKGYRIGELKAILLSPTRINDILPFLHKPKGRPGFDFDVPQASIFRGMVFGHINVFSNKNLSKSQALVLLDPSAAPAPEEPAAEASPQASEAPSFPSYDPTAPPPGSEAPAVPSTAPSVPMVGMPTAEDPAPAAPPLADRKPDPMADPYPTPSPEKLKRWTEIIPSGTRVQRPTYPPAEEEETQEIPNRGAEEKTEIREAPALQQEYLGEFNAEDKVRCAKEADHLIRKIIAHTDHDPGMSFEAKSDLAIELKMLQMELSKFKPNLSRITQMILALSDVSTAGPLIGRLKECLRGLGLLL